MIDGRSGRSSLMTTYLGWPAYLACSWTWCIGMYLPIVLRDMYGWSSVWAFAIPNVVGISLFGFVMRSAGRSRGLVSAYRRPMISFSLLTIAFHAYFLSAVWRWEAGHGMAFGLATALLVLFGTVAASGLSDRALHLAAIGLYGLSVLVLLILLGTSEQPGAWTDSTQRVSFWPVREVGYGVFHWPLFAIGLLLCPYFDLTFHRAYSETAEADARGPFVVFGVLFAVMLLLTCVYWSTGLTGIVVVHLLLQSLFTMTVHWKEIGRVASSSESRLRALRLHAAGGGLVLSVIPLVDYRWWLLYVGLVFPAIAVLTEVRRAIGRRPSHTLAITAVVVVLTPFCFGAFLLNMEWLAVVPTVALVLALCCGETAAGRFHEESSDARPQSAGELAATSGK